MYNVGTWACSGETHRTPIPSTPQLLSDVEHRASTSSGRPRFNSARNAHTFGESADREQAIQQRRENLVASRRQDAAGRVLRYAQDRAAYEQELRSSHRASLEQRQAIRTHAEASERQATKALARQAAADVAAQDGIIAAQHSARRDAHREVAAANLRAMQEKRVQEASQRNAAQARPAQDFMSRFGTSMA